MKRKMTLEEAKRHALRNNAKLIVDGKVFNSTGGAKRPAAEPSLEKRKRVN